MTAIRLSSGGVLLHSPVQYYPNLAAALRAIGPITALLAPSTAHWTQLADWQRAFPQAVTFAAPGLRRRRPVRRAGLHIDAEVGETLPPDWQGDLAHVLLHGAAGFCEVALLHLPTRTAILTDLVQTLGRAGGGWPPIYLRLAVRLGGQRARAAAARILAWQPERVIFSHGPWFEQDGAARLARALAWLVPAG